MNSFVTRGQQINRTQLREQFIHDLLAILGDTRVLWMPKITDTTTSLDESKNGRTFTHDATIAARLQALGLGYYTTFGTANDSDTPDAADLSFTGAAEVWSMLALVNVTDTAAVRTILAKDDVSAQREYEWQIDAADKLFISIIDQSAAAGCSRLSDTAITQGAWNLLGTTFDGSASGATYANAITMYQNGVVKASTATNSGSFVTMDNGTAKFNIGRTSADTQGMSGSMALVALSAKALSAHDHWAVKKLVNYYFGLSL